MASILSKLFKPKTKKPTGFNDTISMVYEPSFTKFGSTVLYSDLVYSALQLKSRFFGKLEPRHIRNEDGKITSLTNSSIAKVLRNPNHYQTPYDFLTQAYFMREKDNTCYILDDKYKTNGGETKHEGLYVLLPSDKPELTQNEKGALQWEFSFDGYNSKVYFDYNEIIVWKKDIEDNQYMGGGKYSKNANADLLNSISSYHTINETIAEAAKLGCMFDGLIKVNAYSADETKNKAIRDKFVEDARNKKSGGIPVLDAGSEYVQVQRQLKFVDATTLNEIKQNVFIDTGISYEMLTGKYTSQDKEAFYENWIEPAAISLGQAMSKVFFSDWQTSHGDQIILYPHKVQLMATSEIVSIIQSTIAAGVFMKDEYRDMLGYAPLPNGEGQTMPRGYNNLDGATTDMGGVTE